MSAPFDPKNWIDPQRAAGTARGNVFADILAASAAHRRARGMRDELSSRRLDRVQEIREAAASHDGSVERVTRTRE